MGGEEEEVRAGGQGDADQVKCSGGERKVLSLIKCFPLE